MCAFAAQLAAFLLHLTTDDHQPPCLQHNSIPNQKIHICRFLTAQQMAARQLPHLAWPTLGSAAAPPMLSFYSFVAAEVVEF